MKEYELVCEYYDTCSPKPRTSFSEIEADSLEDYMAQYIPANASCSRTVTPQGDIVYEVASQGIRKRYIFTEI